MIRKFSHNSEVYITHPIEPYYVARETFWGVSFLGGLLLGNVSRDLKLASFINYPSDLGTGTCGNH
jgi:hypothetical protein